MNGMHILSGADANDDNDDANQREAEFTIGVDGSTEII